MVLPSKMKGPTASVIHSHNSTEDLLFRGNAHLSSGDATTALSLYNRVLYAISPGHAIAFLNRAVAYMWLGYPELAVTDAYRAILSCREMRDPESPGAKDLLGACVTYLRAESLHFEARAEWTEIPRKIRDDRRSPLAWVTFNLAEPPKSGYQDKKLRKELCDLIEFRASYRLADALQRCACGAVADALGVISDSLNTIGDIWRCDKDWMIQLGQDVMNGVELGFRHDLKQFGGLTMKDIMNSKMSLISPEIYPWNDKELDLSDPAVSLPFKFEEHTSNCVPALQDCAHSMMPALELRATEDIFPETKVVSKRWDFVVSTDDPDPYPARIPSAHPPLLGAHPCSPRYVLCHSKVQSLSDRFLSEFIEIAVDEDQHLLDDEVIRMLDGNFYKQRTTDDALPRPRCMPWSFSQNVLSPLHIIEKHLAKIGRNQYDYLERFDGWVINTLISKILHNTQLHPGYRLVKPPGDSPSYIEKTESDTWVACISPILAMIRVADESKGETPNVKIHHYHHDGIVCETMPGNPNVPSVRAGEPLLRALRSFPDFGPDLESPIGELSWEARDLASYLAERLAGGRDGEPSKHGEHGDDMDKNSDWITKESGDGEAMDLSSSL